MLWLQKLKKDDLCWEKGDSLGGWVFAAGGGAVSLDVGVAEEEGKIRDGRGGLIVWWYIIFY
jgi:hypothetical protein